MTTAKKIRVLVVDDSAFMRKAISMMIADDPEIEVVGNAADGEEGFQKVLELSPDLVTMDIEMPKMDGLTALRKIMQEKPTPVMMVSSQTSEGAQATLDALELGAVDFIPKQMSYVSLDIVKIKKELVEKIKQIYGRKKILMAQFRSRRIAESSDGKSIVATPPKRIVSVEPAKSPDNFVPPKKLIRVAVLGTSTGGPTALQQVIPELPANFPVPILIVQHMPPTFTASLARRLNGLSPLEVKEAATGDRIQKGVVLIAPGDQHMYVEKRSGEHFIKLSHEPADSLFRPSVDVMMISAVENFHGAILGVIMTGMGRDGLEGLRKIKKSGGVVIAQSEESCVVFGMPRAAIEDGIADKISPVERIAPEMVSYF